MTPSKGLLYGVVAVFVALLIVTSGLAALYYGQDQQQASQSQKYAQELNSALSDYRALSGSYNSSLSDYGTTLDLLANAVANLNTSSPSYRNASADLASLWASYKALASFQGRKAITFEVRLLVDFGNGTRVWYNDTSAQPGWNAYVATVVLLDGKVQATWYPQYGEHFVTGVDGASQTSTESWFFWESGKGAWSLPASGADGVQVDNGTIFAWTLCTYDISFNPSCTP